MKYRYQRLEAACRGLPDYDHHVIHGLVDTDGYPILGTFVHREGTGCPTNSGRIATVGGGIRWRTDCSSLSDLGAFTDGLRLSKGMSEKSAGLDIPIGGAKTIVFGHRILPRFTADDFSKWPSEVREEIWEAFTTLVLPRIPGYLTAEDSGTSVVDMACIKRFAPDALVAGCTEATDPSPVTAKGAVIGLKIVLHTLAPVFTPALRDGVYAVQGVGAVGGRIVDLLYAAGARNITFSETSEDNARKCLHDRPEIRRVSAEFIHEQPCDVFIPCAFGGSLNERIIPDLHTFAVAGCANNQLATPEDGVRLHEQGILYAPDFIINAGGMAEVISEIVAGMTVDDLLSRIGQTLEHIFLESKLSDRPTAVVAKELAAARMAKTMAYPT